MCWGSPQWLPLVGMGIVLSPIPKTLGLSLPRAGSSGQCTFGISAVERVFRLSFSSFSGRATLQKTSSLVKDRYHFTSSHSSNMLFTNNCGPPPAGRLFCSAQCWRALEYTTTFSLGISLMSLQSKIDSDSGINFCLQRHDSAGGAWRVASLAPNSCIHCGSLKDACTSLASFLQLSLPGTVNSLVHHSRVSHLLAFHGTH